MPKVSLLCADKTFSLIVLDCLCVAHTRRARLDDVSMQSKTMAGQLSTISLSDGAGDNGVILKQI